jgi:hypothetical protein
MLIFVSRFWRMPLTLLLLVLSPLALAQKQAPEAELKAAILTNMLLFVDWPSQSAPALDRLKLCYLSTGPVSTALAQFEGKLIKARAVQVTRVEATTAAGCHALYVSPLDFDSLPRLLPLSRNGGILLVGDTPGYLSRGVMLNLEVDNGRVVFDIDLRSIRQAGLALSSKVLRLARQVLE